MRTALVDQKRLVLVPRFLTKEWHAPCDRACIFVL